VGPDAVGFFTIPVTASHLSVQGVNPSEVLAILSREAANAAHYQVLTRRNTGVPLHEVAHMPAHSASPSKQLGQMWRQRFSRPGAKRATRILAEGGHAPDLALRLATATSPGGFP